MKNKNLIITLILVFLSLSFSCKNNRDAAYAAEADAFLTKLNFQGSVLVAKGSRIIYSKSYGFCDPKNKKSELIKPESVFEAGSLTKQFTAAAIMQLEGQKKLSLQDKLSKYFPDYEYGDLITLEMLLNMRSGLTDCINASEEFFGKKTAANIEKLQLQNKPLKKNILLEYFYKAPLLAPPDSTYFYCNTNYYLLAKIIEQVSGESYEDYLQNHIFNKCKMKNTNLDFQKTDTKGYDYKGRYYSLPKELSLGCGDLNTSTLDLLKWNLALTRGKVTGKRQFKRMIKTNSSYGYGLYHKDKLVFHGGSTNVFNSYNSFYLDSKISVIVLSNSPITKNNATVIAGRLYKMYKISN